MVAQPPGASERLEKMVEYSCRILARTRSIHAIIRGAADKEAFAAALGRRLLQERLTHQTERIRQYLGGALRPGLSIAEEGAVRPRQSRALPPRPGRVRLARRTAPGMAHPAAAHQAARISAPLTRAARAIGPAASGVTANRRAPTGANQARAMRPAEPIEPGAG
jgi:hypothetical protein